MTSLDHLRRTHIMSAQRASFVRSILLALVVLACRDSSGPRVMPRDLEIVSGEQQAAMPGEAAPNPLRVRVTGSDGKPFAGATVRWSATEAQARLDPAQSTTDARGEAETRVTLGGSSSEVNATVEGISPVIFRITAFPPCIVSRRLALETTVTGTLQAFDCDEGNGRLRDYFSFTVATQQALRLRVSAPGFEPYYTLFEHGPLGFFERGSMPGHLDPTGAAVAKWILPPGDYQASASSADIGATGAYELLLSATSSSAEGCELVWMTRGVTTEQRLTPTDCVDSPGPRQRDLFLIVLWIGERVTLTHSSAEFAPRLRLLRRLGAVITEVDGSANGTATIDFTSDETALYLVHATSALAGQTGAYTLSARDPTAAAAPSSAARSSVHLMIPSNHGYQGTHLPPFE